MPEDFPQDSGQAGPSSAGDVSLPAGPGHREGPQGGVGGGGGAFTARQVERARDLLARFYGARRAVHLYPPSHPGVRQAVDGLLAAIREYHAEGTDVPLTFYEDEVLLGEQLLPQESMLFDQLIRDMTAIGATSITFMQGVNAAQLERAVRVLGSDSEELAEAGGLESAVARAALTHVRIATANVQQAEQVPESEGPARARATYDSALGLMRELDRAAKTNGVVPGGNVKSAVEGIVQAVLGNRNAMLELSGLKSHDEYTFYHSINVAILSIALGSLVSRDTRFLSSLGTGALLHDIGKLGVDLEILNKPGALSMDEWDLVRSHPLQGAEMVATIRGLDRAAIVVILEHHMRYDLTGYPRRQTARRQNLASRIVAVADAYDAMTSRRSYSAPRLPDEALAVLARNAGSAFDAALVRLFIDLLGVYPPRAVVRLSSGETGVVVQPSETDPLRPIVRIFSDRDGRLVEPFDIDLSADAQARGIERCLDPEGLNVDVGDYL